MGCAEITEADHKDMMQAEEVTVSREVHIALWPTVRRCMCRKHRHRCSGRSQMQHTSQEDKVVAVFGAEEWDSNKRLTHCRNFRVVAA
jgi:hypothetical protein